LSENAWYRQPWAWFVWIPPLAAVIAGIATLMIAINGADDVIAEDVRKVGMVLEHDTAREDAAAALGLKGQVELGREQGLLALTLEGEAPERLLVRFVHPTDADRDRQGLVQRTADGTYTGALPGGAVVGPWQVLVEPEDRRWRLVGGLDAEATSIALRAGASRS